MIRCVIHKDEARACVAQGWGMAHIASTVKDLGHEMSESNFVLRICAGEGGRIWGGGCRAVTITLEHAMGVDKREELPTRGSVG